MTISQEMLDDTPGLSSYLSQRLPAKINTVIDDQLIGGSGSSPNLSRGSASSEIDLISFVVKQVAVGATQLLASAGLDYQ